MNLEQILNPPTEPETTPQPAVEPNGTKRLMVAQVFGQMILMRNAFERMAKHFADIPEQEKPGDIDNSLNEIIRDATSIQKACQKLLGGNR